MATPMVGSPAEQALLQMTQELRRGVEAARAAAEAARDSADKDRGDKHRKLNLQLLDRPKKFEHALPEDEDRDFP